MRIAILSDIHSNVQALTKALSIIDRMKIETVYCLGDIVGYGGSPNECVNLIRERASHAVMGNHDLAATDPSHAFYFTHPGRMAAEWTHTVLQTENLEYLSALTPAAETEYCTLVHANPADPLEWGYISSLQDAKAQFDSFSKPVCFVGHTHVPFQCGEDLRSFSLKKGVRFLINVGSVGQPRDANPDLSFGVFDTDVWTYQNIRSPYDIEGAAQAILNRGLPRVLATRLYQGI
jgi:predicted phosphodiesterase